MRACVRVPDLRYLRQPGETGGVLVPAVAVRSCPPCVVAVIVQVA